MSPTEIAQQQLWAAWVSAGAAVLQALGAALAIFWTVRLAREADARTIRLENAAVEREKVAELASAARAAAAEAAAQERAEKDARLALNEPIDLVLALATATLTDIDEKLGEARSQFSSKFHGTIMGAYDSPRLAEMREAIQRASAQTTNPDLVIAYNNLARRAVRWDSTLLATDEYLAAFERFRDQFADTAEVLRGFRRE